MINKERVTQTFLDYVRIDSETHYEKEMTARLVADLEQLGLEVYTDQAGKIPGVDSDGANVYCFLEGDPNYDAILFSSHMDTVTPGKGIEPYIEDGYIRTRGNTILGADDKSGVAAIMEALRTLVETGAPHRPVEVIFTIREEPIWSMTVSGPNMVSCWTPATMWESLLPVLPARCEFMPISTVKWLMQVPIRKRVSAPFRQQL